MAIEITEDLLGMWFIPLTDSSDWLAGATDMKDGKFLVQYRFRYCSPVGDGNPFNDEDVKRWSECTMTGCSREKVIANMRLVAECLSDESGGKLYDVLMVNGDVMRFFTELKQMPFVHGVQVPELDGRWRCHCGHENEIIFRSCQSCVAPLTESHPFSFGPRKANPSAAAHKK